MILPDVRGPTLSIVREPCGRRGRYRVDKLLAEHRDAKRFDGEDESRAMLDEPKRLPNGPRLRPSRTLDR